MSEIDKDNNFISCSRCQGKSHNTSESITKNLGYTRLGDRYKLCIKCRATTHINECCICMKRLNRNNIINIKCNHNICKCCIDKIDKTNRSNIVKCPIYKQEYTVCDNLKPILFKVVLRDNIDCGFAKPCDILQCASRTNLNFVTCSGVLSVDEKWIKRTAIIYNILRNKMSSGNYSTPLTLYVYKDGNLPFT